MSQALREARTRLTELRWMHLRLRETQVRDGKWDKFLVDEMTELLHFIMVEKKKNARRGGRARLITRSKVLNTSIIPLNVRVNKR